MTPTQIRLTTTRTVGSSRPWPPSEMMYATSEYPIRVYR